MDEPTDDRRVPEEQTASWLRRDWVWLAILLAIVGTLRCWLIVNTEVTARDSIGFIRYALLFDRLSWSETLLSQHQHPGYPALIWLVAAPLRTWFGTTPETMRLAAQLVSAAASLALAVVMFRLGRMLWNRYVGFFAALLFQLLPIPGHHLSDGVSDGLFLLVAMAALDAIIRARAFGSAWRYAVGGTLIGLAYLVRPEGLLVLPAAWLFLIGFQFSKANRTAWRDVGSGLATLTLACVVAGSPYFLATGQITQKVSARQIIDEAAAGPTESGGWPLFASLFAANFAPSANFQGQIYRTMRALTFELCQALNYVGGVFALWALVFCRPTLARHFGFALLSIYFGIHAAILVKLGLTVSYVSDRHVMALVALACYPSVIGVLHVMSVAAARWRTDIASGNNVMESPAAKRLAAVVLVLALVICGGKTATRLHGNRVGNHLAGLWLAENARAGDIIDDDHNWSHYYAGQVFLEGREPSLSPSATPHRFVVVTRSRDADVHERRQQKEAELKASKAELVYRWPATSDAAKARIAVYSMPRDFRTHPWTKDPAANVFQPVSREK